MITMQHFVHPDGCDTIGMCLDSGQTMGILWESYEKTMAMGISWKAYGKLYSLWILWLSIVSGCDGSDGYSYIVIAVVMISMTMVVNTILMWMSLMIVLRCAPEEIP